VTIHELAQLVRQRREELRLTQEELARQANITRSWLALVETAKRLRPEREMLERLALALSEPPAKLLELAGYSVRPLAVQESSIPYPIKRELELAFTGLPIRVPLASGPISAGGGAPVEALAYYPSDPEERTHRFAGYEVVGECLEPMIMRGHFVIVDMTVERKPGDIVAVRHDGEAMVKILTERGGKLYLSALQGPTPQAVDETTQIIGVVKGVQYIPRVPPQFR
jgi:transcriptional regulator with XRE-family HTH domain